MQDKELCTKIQYKLLQPFKGQNAFMPLWRFVEDNGIGEQYSFPRGQLCPLLPFLNCLKAVFLSYCSPHFPSTICFSFEAKLSKGFRHLMPTEMKE